MVTKTKHSCYKGDDIPLGQPSLQPSFEAGSESQGNGNNNSSVSVALSSSDIIKELFK